MIEIDNAEKSQQVYSRAAYYSRLAMGNTRFSIPQRRSETNKVAAMTTAMLKRKIQEHKKKMLATIRVQLLVYGDVNAATAAETAGIFASKFRKSKALLPEEARVLASRPTTLTQGVWGVQRRVKRENENDSAVMVTADLATRMRDCKEVSSRQTQTDGSSDSQASEPSNEQSRAGGSDALPAAAAAAAGRSGASGVDLVAAETGAGTAGREAGAVVAGLEANGSPAKSLLSQHS